MTAAVSTPYTAPAGLMDALQVTVLVLVAVGATAVVLIRAHVRQVLALSVYGVLLAIFYVLDRYFLRIEGPAPPPGAYEPIAIDGGVNFPLIAGVLGAVLLSGIWKPEISFDVAGTPLELQDLVRDGALLALTALSLALTPREVRERNGFSWAPISEVAQLFAGIFLTVIPVIAMLQAGRSGTLANVVALVTDGRRGASVCGRGERERSAVDEAADRDVPATSSAVRMTALLFTGPVVVMGWWLASHAQTSPSGGFQGGVILATAFILLYLSGEFLVFKRFSPVDLTDVVEAVGAGGFAAIGVSAVAMGLPYLYNFPRSTGTPGAVSSSGTIALISFFVGLEVAAAFILIVAELLDQTLLIRHGSD
jgi:multisubunit Na+/H+ antiporter MnhB subunit